MPLEDFRAWERTGRFVHVMQIDRGDGSPAHRLTLTDKPYVDKGAGGSKYHDTYPAPIQCIISEIETDEQMDGTSFADIVCANGDGRLTALFTYPNLVGFRGVMLRGDPSWSLMETDLPNRFIEIFRCQVEDVQFRLNGREIVLKISPLKYKLDNVIGAPDSPIAFGVCRNVPATLVDAALQRYRFNTRQVLTGDTNFRLRDQGVLLATPDDYAEVTESSEFRGQAELVAPAAGQLTADLNWSARSSITGSSAIARPLEIIKQVISEHLVEDYDTEDSSLDLSAHGSDFRCMFSNRAGTKLFFYDHLNGIFQYSNASHVSAATYDSKSFDPGTAFMGAWVDPTDTYVYLSQPGVLRIYQITPDDISTASLLASLTYSTVYSDSATPVSFTVSDDEKSLFLLNEAGRVWRIDIPTPRTFSGLSATLVGYVNAPWGDTGFQLKSLLKSSDGKHLFVAVDAGWLEQFELPAADDFSGFFYGKRQLFLDRHSSILSKFRSYCLNGDGQRLYGMRATTVTQHNLPEADQLPRRIFACAYNSFRVGEINRYTCGLFYQGETPIGQVIADAAEAVGYTYCVGALGEIRMGRSVDTEFTPLDFQTVHDIPFSAFLGERGTNILHVNTHLPAYKITVQYDHNNLVQTAADLAGGVTPADVEYYSKEYRTEVLEQLLLDYQDPREIVLTGRFMSFNEVDTYAGYELLRWNSERYEYDITLNLRCVSLLEDFSIGSLIRATDDWKHPHFEPDPYFEVGGILSSTRVSSPDTSLNSVAGAFSVCVRLRLDSYSTAFSGFPVFSDITIFAKSNSAGTTGAWNLQLTNDGHLNLKTSTTGSSTLTDNAMSMTAEEAGILKNRWLWLRVDYTPNNGSNRQIDYYLSYKPGNDIPGPDEWKLLETVLGSSSTGTFNSNASVTVGNGGEGIQGEVSRAVLVNNVTSQVAADLDARDATDQGSFVSSVTGETWTPEEPCWFEGKRLAVVIGRRVNWSRNMQTLRVFK